MQPCTRQPSACQDEKQQTRSAKEQGRSLCATQTVCSSSLLSSEHDTHVQGLCRETSGLYLGSNVRGMLRGRWGDKLDPNHQARAPYMANAGMLLHPSPSCQPLPRAAGCLWPCSMHCEQLACSRPRCPKTLASLPDLICLFRFI